METSESQRWADARFRLRDGLKHWVQSDGTNASVVLEDPLRNKYFRLGLPEWHMARQLDGDRTLQELATSSAATNRSASSAWQLDQLSQLVTMLHKMQLLEGTGTAPRITPALRFNPFFLRLPLGNPDQWLDRCQGLAAWLFSRRGLWIWCGVVACGGYTLLRQGARFAQGWQGILSTHNWFGLFLVWFLLKLVHETCHALACKRFGGHVPQAGLAFILFSPVAYVDVTSAWRFTSRWQRMVVSAAGMYGEFFCAAVAALLWGQLPDGVGSQMCHNLIVSASLTTLAFNANFLMRFDGYYIVSDGLDLPNLSTLASSYTRYLFQRFVLGESVVDPTHNGRWAWFVRAYALCAMAWRITVSVGMVLVASTLFRGAGIVLSLFALLSWWIVPGWAWLRQSVVAGRGKTRRLVRLGLAASGGGMALAALLGLPWPGGVLAPGIVDYAPLPVVRVETDGFVREVCVQAGELVAPGQLLVRLENAPLLREWGDAQRQRQQSELRARIHQRNGEIEKYMMEHELWDMWNGKVEELQRRVESLEIRAPVAGRVVAPELSSRVGQYLAKGEALLSLGIEQHKEIVLSIAQDDVEEFKKRVGAETSVRVWGYGRVAGARIDHIQPRGTLQLPHPALGAALGGPLPVRPKPGSDKGPATGSPFELPEPRFVAHVQLPPETAQQLYAGQLAKLRVPSQWSIAGYFQYRVQQWMRSKLATGKHPVT